MNFCPSVFCRILGLLQFCCWPWKENNIVLQYYGSNSFTFWQKRGMTTKWPVVWKKTRRTHFQLARHYFLKCLEGTVKLSRALIENRTFLDTFFTASAKTFKFFNKNTWNCNYFREGVLPPQSHSFSGMKNR